VVDLSLYVRYSSGGAIRWEPPESAIGRTAVESVVGPADSYPVEVDSETAAEIRAEYQRLREEQTSGGSA